VESIHSYCYFRQNKKLQYLIRWKGYPESNNMWEPANSIHASDLVKVYKQRTTRDDINSDPNNSSCSITLSPLLSTWQPGSLEPHPHCQQLVPSTYTSSIQHTSTHKPLPIDLTTPLALHYIPLSWLYSRVLYSPHSYSCPQA
jgi:hypothetical protein